MTPQNALRRVAPSHPCAVLVQRPKSPVVHVSASPDAKRGRPVPLCGVRGKRWPAAGFNALATLCRRCTRHIATRTWPTWGTSAAMRAWPGWPTAEQLRAEVEACPTLDDLEQLRAPLIRLGQAEEWRVGIPYGRRRDQLRADLRQAI